jgi:hypothetical protein
MLKLLARLIIPEDRVLFTSLHLVKAFDDTPLTSSIICANNKCIPNVQLFGSG